MEWLIGIPVVALLLLCPLMMFGMIIGGWVFGRRAMGHGGGHGMMMCHPMGHGSDERTAPTVADLKAERDRLDEIIARAERDGVAG
ncbi:MAG TPA: hypothetical protein VLS25_08790 [Dehalococcoidia bacterium]|nr:hypothetical protein [Dehalococcoidia bacterium]